MQVDMVTPMCSQLTYEGLLDEVKACTIMVKGPISFRVKKYKKRKIVIWQQSEGYNCYSKKQIMEICKIAFFLDMPDLGFSKFE